MQIANSIPHRAIRATGRFWEIDAVRGIAVILMVYFHLMWNLFYFNVTTISVFTFEWQAFARTIGSTFTFLLGLSLAIRRERVIGELRSYLGRGVFIFGWGMFVSAATFVALGANQFVIFGILHLQGIALILCYLFARFPAWMNVLAGGMVVAVGTAIYTTAAPYPWLIPLGIQQEGRYMADYYPILPWLGPALFGVAAGKLFYVGGNRGFVLPAWGEVAFVRALRFLGRHSLVIYLVHQVIIIGMMILLGLAKL